MNENKLRKRGQVMILAPKHLSPKIRNDLKRFTNNLKAFGLVLNYLTNRTCYLT